MRKGSSESPFLSRVRDVIRTRQYSIRTEQAYTHGVKRFILFHNKRHPKELGEAEVAEFMTHLAVNRQVSPSTQNQALNALVFLYRHVLDRPLGDILGAVRARRPERLPVILSRTEVRQLFAHLDGPHWLPGCLLYGSGLRLMECLRLRVKDLDFDHRAITVRCGKGGKDRIVTLPERCIEPLKQQLALVRRLQCAAASGVGDEGMVPRNRLTGAGCKPPQAAWVKSPGRERCGKGADRHQVRTEEGEQP